MDVGFSKDNVSITLSTIDHLIKIGKELNYKGQTLQNFVKQQQKFERAERYMEREHDKEKPAVEKENRD